MPKVRWVMSHGFCSKFHTLSNNAQIWKSVKIWQRYRQFKSGNFFLRHRVDAACYYRPSSVVCRSVCLSVTVVSPAQTAEPIEMPFGLRTWVGPENQVLDEVQIPHEKGRFWEGGAAIIKYRYRHTLRWAVQKWLNRSRCRLGSGLEWAQGSIIR